MFENLSDKLDQAFKILKGQGRITDINVAETLKEVRKALLDADVNFKVAKQFTYTVKEKELGQNVLKVLGEQIEVPVYSEVDNKNPVDISKKAIEFAKANNYNVVIIDTAGRLAIDEQMMNEIAAIKDGVRPHEILFVVDSMTGQDA